MAHVNPLASRSDSNDGNAGADGHDGGDDDANADAMNADVHDGVNDEQRPSDDVNDDDAERQQRHFAHALQRQQPQNLHRHPLWQPWHDDPIPRPMARQQSRRCDDP